MSETKQTNNLKKYINWEGKEKFWNVHTEGVFFVRASERLSNPDGSFFNDFCLARFTTAFETNQVVRLLKAARPDWADKIQAVKAPCVFDGFKTYINVERWI